MKPAKKGGDRMTIHRRTFVQAATALAVGAAGTRVAQAQAPAPAQLMPTAPAAAGTMTALPDLSSLDPKAPPPPKPDGVPAPTMKRFQEQRWVLDNIIRANGIDWDQPRLPGLRRAWPSKPRTPLLRSPRAFRNFPRSHPHSKRSP